MRNGTDYVLILIVLLILSAPFWLPVLIGAWNNAVIRSTPPSVPLSADEYRQRHTYLTHEMERIGDGHPDAIETLQVQMRQLEHAHEMSGLDKMPVPSSRLHLSKKIALDPEDMEALMDLLSKGPTVWNAWRMQNQDVSYIDLTHQNLSNRDFSWFDFQYVDFSGSDLRGAKLKGANLSHALCISTRFDPSGLKGAILQGVNLDAVFIDGNPPYQQLTHHPSPYAPGGRTQSV